MPREHHEPRDDRYGGGGESDCGRFHAPRSGTIVRRGRGSKGKWDASRGIEFDVADAAAVTAAADELQQAGYDLLHPAREEPWGQTVAGLQSPEGVILGISYVPVLHD